MRRDDWETPQKLFDFLNTLFKFRVDAAADENNHKCPTYYSERDNALSFTWDDSWFCNPPYSLSEEFALHALEQGQRTKGCLLLPVRSDRLWFQKVLNSAFTNVTWITGRLHFGGSNKAAFMYSVLFWWHPTVILPKYLQAGQFNDNGKGDARS